jgi:hypothetical protein
MGHIISGREVAAAGERVQHHRPPIGLAALQTPRRLARHHHNRLEVAALAVTGAILNLVAEVEVLEANHRSRSFRRLSHSSNGTHTARSGFSNLYRSYTDGENLSRRSFQSAGGLLIGLFDMTQPFPRKNP